MMWKCIARLCTKYKQDGTKDQKAFTGEDLTKLQEKRHGRIDDFYEKNTQNTSRTTQNVDLMLSVANCKNASVPKARDGASQDCKQ